MQKDICMQVNDAQESLDVVRLIPKIHTEILDRVFEKNLDDITHVSLI